MMLTAVNLSTKQKTCASATLFTTHLKQQPTDETLF
jgi:hypothetical protein